jgi:TetR/AcrR family transcriptional regulator
MQNGADKSEIKKDQIKTAALRCFSQYGYNKTTMDDIANAIGMKKASLYYYYKNKETIICDTIESEIYNFLKTANEKISKIKSATKKLYLLVNWETEFFQERVGTFDISVNTIMEAQPLLHEMMENARVKDVDMWARIIQEGIEKNEFRKCNAYKIADTIRTVLDAIKFREFHHIKVLTANEIDYEKIKKTGKEMIDLIINGLKLC